MPKPLATFALVAVLASCIGCGDLIPPRPPISRNAEQPVTPPPASDANDQNAGVTEPSEEESEYEGDWSGWYVHRLGSKVVGMSQVAAASKLNLDELLAAPTEITYRRAEQLVFRSGRVSFQRRMELSSVERPDGSLQQFRSDVSTGPIPMRVQGATGKGKLNVVSVVAGEQNRQQIDWPDKTRGLFALEQTLRRDQIEKGETRRLEMLLPTVDSIGVIELRCNGEASVAMLDGKYRLLREIDVMTFRDAQLIDSMVVWVDDQGAIEKSLRPDLRLESFRTDETTARSMFKSAENLSIRLSAKGSLRDPEPARVGFRVGGLGSEQADSDGDQATSIVPAVANQSVRRADGVVDVLVEKEPADGEPGEGEGYQRDRREVADADLAASKSIDFGNAAVSRMASSVGELPVDELASELTRLVHNRLSLAPQGTLRPASQIVRAGSGGSIDHAIVLVSLLRAREIPSRVVLGLVRSENDDSPKQGSVSMKLSAWAIALVDGQWVAIDPMTNRVNRADQICLTVPQADGDLPSELEAVFRKLTTMQVTVEGAEYP